MLISTNLEDVYIGPSLVGFKRYFEVLRDDDKSNDNQSGYTLFDLEFPNSVKGDQIAKVFGLELYKTLAVSCYGFELFKETVPEVKEFLREDK